MPESGLKFIQDQASALNKTSFPMQPDSMEGRFGQYNIPHGAAYEDDDRWVKQS